jgi:hypothetical protein
VRRGRLTTGADEGEDVDTRGEDEIEGWEGEDKMGSEGGASAVVVEGGFEGCSSDSEVEEPGSFVSTLAAGDETEAAATGACRLPPAPNPTAPPPLPALGVSKNAPALPPRTVPLPPLKLPRTEG